MKLRMLRSTCMGGTCPTVYVAENGDFVVQGYELDAATAGNLAHLSPGENAVRISADVVIKAVEAYQAKS